MFFSAFSAILLSEVLIASLMSKLLNAPVRMWCSDRLTFASHAAALSFVFRVDKLIEKFPLCLRVAARPLWEVIDLRLDIDCLPRARHGAHSLALQCTAEAGR